MSEGREENFNWIINQNLTDYKGKWIVVVNKQIVSKGKNAAKVVELARKKYPNEIPFLFKVPTTEILTMTSI